MNLCQWNIFLFLLYAVDNNVADTVGESEFVEALFAEAVADVGDVHTAAGQGYDVCGVADVFDGEDVLLHAFAQDVAENLYLFLCDDFLGAVPLPDVAEETRAQRAVAAHYLLHRLEAAHQILFELGFGILVACGYLAEAVQELVALALYHGVENLPLALEIGINGASALVRG